MKRIIVCLIAMAMLIAAVAIPASAAGEADFRLMRVVRISDTEVAYIFNKDVADANLPNNFVCLRWQMMDGDTIKGLAWEGETPLQAAAGNKKFLDDNHKNIVIVEYTQRHLDLFQETEGNSWYDSGLRAFAGMEECNVPADHSHDVLETCLSADGMQLVSNYKAPEAAWDGAYCTIETDYDFVAKMTSDFRLVKAVRISDTELVLEFNKELSAEGINKTWTSLRWHMMLENGTPHKLAWTGGDSDKGDPLQFAPKGKAFYEGDNSKIVLTFAKETLDSCLETEGNEWYDQGYRMFISIEEHPPKPHYYMVLDLITAVDGSVLQGNVNTPYGWNDAAAAPIEVNYDYAPVAPEAPETGDATLAAVAIAAVAAMGAVVFATKKR